MENLEGKLLIVEDEPLIASLYQEFLIEYGFQSTICDNGAMALKLYKKAQPAFDLVITDETMPEMTGTELSKALLALTPKLPIILLSGLTEVALTQANENLNISHYLKKPVSLFDLKDTIEACLAIK